MKKNIILILVTVIIILLITLLFNLENITLISIKKYLNSKYNETFTFVSEDDNVQFSKIKMYIFKDKFNNEFLVKKSGDFLLDNYYSIKFDELIQRKIEITLDANLKTFANSSFTFTSKKDKYLSFDDYLDSGLKVEITIYTRELIDKYKITDILKKIEKQGNFSITVYYVSNYNYEKVLSYNDEVDYIDKISFLVKNGVIAEKIS